LFFRQARTPDGTPERIVVHIVKREL